MKLRKRLLSLLLCTTMSAATFCVPAFAEEDLENPQAAWMTEDDNSEMPEAYDEVAVEAEDGTDLESKESVKETGLETGDEKDEASSEETESAVLETSEADESKKDSANSDAAGDNDLLVDELNKTGDEDEDSEVKTEKIVLPEITGFTVTPVKNYSGSKTRPYLYLSWDAVEGADGYYVWRSTTEGVFPEEPHIIRTKADYSNSSVKKDVIYYYKVAAFKNVVIEDEENPEETICETIVGPESEVISGTFMPGELGNFTVETEVRSDMPVVELKWENNGDADGFYVYRGKSKSSLKLYQDINDPGATGYVNKSVLINTKYCFKVVPYSLVDGEVVTGPETKAITVNTADVTLPMEITASASDKDITIRVDRPTDYKTLKAAIWSKKNGQDDIVWADFSRVGSGKNYNSYQAVISGMELRNSGTIYYYIYQNGDILDSGTLTYNGSVNRTDRKVSARINGENLEITVIGDRIYNSLHVGTWSTANGQDDLFWFSAVRNENGDYVMTVPLSYYGDFGEIRSDVYEGNTLVAALTNYVTEKQYNVSEPNYVKYNNGNIIISYPAVWHGKQYSNIRYAIWSDANGQNDISWINSSKANGQFIKTWSTANLKHSGKIYIHVYDGDRFVKEITSELPVEEWVKALSKDHSAHYSDIDFVQAALNIAYNDAIGYGHRFPYSISCAGLVGLSLTATGHGDFISLAKANSYDYDDEWGYSAIGDDYVRELLRAGFTKYDFNDGVNAGFLRPGDLLYYFYNEEVAHIAIYIGNGYVVDAPGGPDFNEDEYGSWSGKTQADDNGREVCVRYIVSDLSIYQNVFRPNWVS